MTIGPPQNIVPVMRNISEVLTSDSAFSEEHASIQKHAPLQ